MLVMVWAEHCPLFSAGINAGAGLFFMTRLEMLLSLLFSGPLLPEVHRNGRRLLPLADPPLASSSASGLFFEIPEEPCHDSNTGRPHIVAERKTGLG